MTYYGAKEIAASFRVVRNNTLKIAEEIPEDKYSFRPAEGSRTIAQTLIHISNAHRFALEIHHNNLRSTMEGFNFPAFIGPIAASEQEPMTKAQIVARLTAAGEEFETWVKTLSPESLMKPTPESMQKFAPTVSHILHMAGTHLGMHMGQMQVVRRKLGKPVLF